MNPTHYSRQGYNGDYTEDSVCGRKIHTHSKDEDISIHPDKTTCLECLQTKEHTTDLANLNETPEGVKRRIYIESDILQADEFSRAQYTVKIICSKNKLKYVDRIFSEVLNFAWHDLEKTWNAVKRADEIYATSSLVPLWKFIHGSSSNF